MTKKDLHSASNSWRTPDWLFKELDKEFHFDIDLCATGDNTKCYHYCSDYLTDGQNTKAYIEYRRELGSGMHWKDWCKTAFMNPPYSNPKPFIEKAWEDSKHCKIVCLVKCDPSTKWWATFWQYSDLKCELCSGIGYKQIYISGQEIKINCTQCVDGYLIKAGPKPGCDYKFFTKRIKFDPPQSMIDKGYTELSGPTFPSALIIMDRRGL